jgi:hypothetical protein
MYLHDHNNASDGDVKPHGYTDSDWVRSVVDQKSTYGCYFSLGSM